MCVYVSGGPWGGCRGPIQCCTGGEGRRSSAAHLIRPLGGGGREDGRSRFLYPGGTSTLIIMSTGESFDSRYTKIDVLLRDPKSEVNTDCLLVSVLSAPSHCNHKAAHTPYNLLVADHTITTTPPQFWNRVPFSVM